MVDCQILLHELKGLWIFSAFHPIQLQAEHLLLLLGIANSKMLMNGFVGCSCNDTQQLAGKEIQYECTSLKYYARILLATQGNSLALI